MSKLIFIGCMPRSGSSLLRVMLNAHPAVYAGTETKWSTYENEAKSKQILDAHINAHTTEPFLVDKNPHNISIKGLKRIKSWYPNAPIIHIIRNPYDVWSSYFKTLENPSEERPANNEFVKDATWYLEGINYATNNKIQMLTIKYEDLVSDPGLIIRRICRYTRIPFKNAMLNHQDHQHKILNHHSDRNAIKPIFNSSIGQFEQYKTYIKPSEENFISQMDEIYNRI